MLDTSPCCVVAPTLSLIGDKWTVLTVIRLGSAPRRFNDLRRSIGDITQRMLTLTLRKLEREGLVTRTVHPTVPPSVEYALTDLGRSLNAPLAELGIWALRNHEALDAARRRFDATHSGTG
jgi:DNA-binding HxlR family transcriptional regulator